MTPTEPHRATTNEGRAAPPQGQQTLGVLVTNYETWDLTRRCLDHVLSHGEGVDRILVVDDASSSPPPNDLDPRIELLINEQNRGLPASLNVGLREIGADLVVIFDSDAYPISPFADRTRTTFAQRSDLAVLGFETVDEQGERTGSWDREPGVMSLVLGQRLYRIYLRMLRPIPAKAISVYTCAMALRRSAALEIGGFDEGLDWLDLDHDLCIRLRAAGMGIDREPRIRAFHTGGGAPQSAAERVMRWYATRWRLLSRSGKIRHPAAVRGLVTLRLRAELLLLQVAGRLLIRSPERLKETIEGRTRLLAYCRQHFR